MKLLVNFILGATFMVCPFFQSDSSASEKKFIVSYNLSNGNTDVKDIVESTILKIIQKDGKYIPFLNVNINLGLEYKTGSYTDAKNNYCKININYHDRKPLLMDDFQDDLQFILAHEVGHCILGKEIFYQEKFNWVIDDKNIERLNQQLFTQTNLSINSLECKKCSFNIAPPIAVYHEIYADIYALTWFNINNDNLQKILMLSKKRIDDFATNPLKSFYGSGFSIPIMLEYIGENNKLNTIEQVEIVSQKGFLKYLNFMNQNYFNTLKNRSKNHD